MYRLLSHQIQQSPTRLGTAARIGWLFLAMASVSLAGCLSKPAADGQAMCEVSTDCPSVNHLCDQGVCWGDPPDPRRFAAVLIPPADRSDLAPTELTQITIAPDGTIGGMDFGPTVTLHGRIELGCGSAKQIPNGDPADCEPNTLIPAQVLIERTSSFAGGPQFRRTVLTNIEASEEEDSFSISLPMDGAEYQVTVLPDEVSLESIASGGAQIQAPPFSTLVRSDSDIDVLWEIGSPDQLKKIEGCVISGVGNGTAFSGMRVSAIGKWTSFSKGTRASSLVSTDEEGCFSLSVPIDMQDEFDIVVKPGPGQTLPTIKLSDIYVRDPDIAAGEVIAHTITPLIMPDLDPPVEFQLALQGRTGGGELEPILGASVTFDTVFQISDTETRDIQVSFSAQTVSSALEGTPGIAFAKLYPARGTNILDYRVRVSPTADAEHAAIFDGLVPIGSGEETTMLPALELARRIPVSGTITNSFNQVLANTPIKVSPSQVMREELTTAAERALLDNLQFASELTGENGEFLVWLDPTLLGLFARYDIELAPSDFSSAPRWIFDGVSVDAAPGEAVNLGVLPLPPASYARGTIRDTQGLVVPGAEIRWYELSSNDDCAPPQKNQGCQRPARSLGIWESDDAGDVIAVLPDPQGT